MSLWLTRNTRHRRHTDFSIGFETTKSKFAFCIVVVVVSARTQYRSYVRLRVTNRVRKQRTRKIQNDNVLDNAAIIIKYYVYYVTDGPACIRIRLVLCPTVLYSLRRHIGRGDTHIIWLLDEVCRSHGLGEKIIISTSTTTTSGFFFLRLRRTCIMCVCRPIADGILRLPPRAFVHMYV